MNKSPFIERNERMIVHLLSGKTLSEIGKIYGITGSRVNQCISRLLRIKYPKTYDSVKSENTHLVITRKLKEKYEMKEA